MTEYQAPIAIPPGETIIEILKERGIGEEFPGLIGVSEPFAIALLHGQVRIDMYMAVKLEHVLDIPATYWLNLEKQYNETLLRLWDKDLK